MALPTRSKIPITLEPLQSWERTGEFYRMGNKDYPVYRRIKQWAVRSVQVMSSRTEKLADGRDRVIKSRKVLIPQAFYAEPDPRAGKAVPEDEFGILMNDDHAPTVQNPDAFEEFIQIDTGVGKDELVFNFREDPVKEAARERERVRKEKWDRILNEFDPDDIAAALAVGADDNVKAARK